VFGITSSTLGEGAFLDWGWRLPFLLSAALIAVGMFIRLRLLETPAFARLQADGKREARPLVTAIRDYRRSLLLAMGMRVAENGLFYIYTVFVLSYGPTALGVTRSTMLWGVTLAAAMGLVAIPCFGALSDRVGRRPVYLFGALFSLVYALPFFWLLETRSTPIIWAAIVGGVAIGHNAMYGPQAAYFSELFGAGVRYSGASLAYQLASILAGGLAPFIATALLAAWGIGAVAAYMMLLSAITVAATYAAPETARSGLAH
jgi:MHS family shikimate/dehydroshikimate transporter-like MFS transporter